MLQKARFVFLKFDSSINIIDGKPHFFLSILDRNSGKCLGQLRFNVDSTYSDSLYRMSFDVLQPQLLAKNSNYDFLLKDIIIAGLAWFSHDNHYLVKGHRKVYMVIHNYPEDSAIMKEINLRTEFILKDINCEQSNIIRNEKHMWIYDPANVKSSNYISDYLKY